MRVPTSIRLAATLAVAGLTLAACSSDSTSDAAGGSAPASDAPSSAAAAGELTPVKLQLQWFAQAQFAGYYAAVAEGFYKEEGLDVSILEGAVDIVPQQVVSSGGAEFGLAWVPKALVSNASDAGLVNVGQVFQRSGTLMVSWKDSGITAPADWKGKTVGNWGFGNEFELTAAIEQAGVTDVNLVAQNFDMEGLLNREIDAAEAMRYNEYAQVLETKNPATGELYKPEDLNVIDFNDVGTAMLQDAVWATADYAQANPDTVEAFLRGSFKGWIFCRDNADKCLTDVLDAGPTLGASHQEWQLNEINALIWPSPDGIGVMDPAEWKQTVDVATTQIPDLKGVTVPDTSYTTKYAEAAVAKLKADGLDVTGEGFTKASVTLNEGGE
jgi:NitT/TauT family transport system substrate-binding protein